MATMGTSTIKSMPIQDWPKADQDAWARAVAVGDILDDGGLASRWAKATKNKCEVEYGRWLSFLDHIKRLDRIRSPCGIPKAFYSGVRVNSLECPVEFP